MNNNYNCTNIPLIFALIKLIIIENDNRCRRYKKRRKYK